MLQHLRIRARLATGFGLVLAGMAIMAAIGFVALQHLGGRIDAVGQQIYARADALGALERAIKDRDIAVRDLASQDDPTVVIGEIKRFKAARDEFKGLRETFLAQLAGDAPLLALADKLDASNADAQKAVEAVLNHAMTGNAPEAMKAAREGLGPVQARSNETLQGIRKLLAERAEQTVAGAHAAKRSSQTALAAAVGLLLVLGSVTAWLIARSVVQPLQQASQAADAIAAGDLTQQLQASGRDEAADLLRTLARMQDSLRHLVGQVRSGVDEVQVASGEIAQGNLDLSSRTEHQASNLQRTGSSMGLMSQGVQASARSAESAHELAAKACAVAGQGGEQVQRVVGTMQEIETASRRIGDIIGTIDSIAFQTNILALNAAVEAARAGEEGRGFAVVAGEVRSLAQRSAQAAREIKSLIANSGERVAAGTSLVAEAGATMQDIVAQVREVSELIGQISRSSREQSNGIGEINGAIAELDQMTQQNAALVEQSAAAAQSMAHQAERRVLLPASAGRG
jgi:methyl-accepting chemotaxis protein